MDRPRAATTFGPHDLYWCNGCLRMQERQHLSHDHNGDPLCGRCCSRDVERVDDPIPLVVYERKRNGSIGATREVLA